MFQSGFLQAFEFADYCLQLANFFRGNGAVGGHHVQQRCCQRQVCGPSRLIQLIGFVLAHHRIVVFQGDRPFKGGKGRGVDAPSGFHALKQGHFISTSTAIGQQGVAHIGQHTQSAGFVQHLVGIGQKLGQRYGLHILNRHVHHVLVATNHRLELAALGIVNFSVAGHHVQQCRGQHQMRCQSEGGFMSLLRLFRRVFELVQQLQVFRRHVHGSAPGMSVPAAALTVCVLLWAFKNQGLNMHAG